MSDDVLDSAIILAAGLGERMRPLTTHTPKPLLYCGGKRLIEWHLEALARAGFSRVIINISHLAEQFEPALGDGSRWGLSILYSHEGAIPLETGGGIWHALPLLQREQFLVVNGDVFCDVDFANWRASPAGLARLLLVDNPPQHPAGDFHLDQFGQVFAEGSPKLTYSGIGTYRSALWDDWQTQIATDEASLATPPRFKLAPLLRRAMRMEGAEGIRHEGRWHDIGTPERLYSLDAEIQTPRR